MPEQKFTIKNRDLNRKTIFNIFRYILAGCITLIMVFPLYWMFITAVKSQEEVLLATQTIWPSEFHFENFINIFNKVPFAKYFYNTTVMTAGIVLLQVFTGIFAAYGFSKGRFKGRDALFLLVLGALMVPVQVTFIPLYILCAKLNWINTFVGLIIPEAVSSYYIFMLRQAFMSVDNSYIEAAKIDGMGRIGIIMRVLAPMCKSSIITITLITVINGWNAYFWPKIITNGDNRRVLTIGLTQLRSAFGAELINNYHEVMAAVVMSILPIIILFVVFQKQMLSGYSKAAMK